MITTQLAVILSQAEPELEPESTELIMDNTGKTVPSAEAPEPGGKEEVKKVWQRRKT